MPYKNRADRLAAHRRYNSSDKRKAVQLRYKSSENGSEVQRRCDSRSFLKFKRALSIRIECLRHTSVMFREARIQEILNWAGTKHSYWVETEIAHACA